MASSPKSADEVLAKVRDGLRYTVVSDARSYVTAFQAITDELRAAGHRPAAPPKVTWSNPSAYKGVNTTWLDHRTGLAFEVQFHTPDSYQAKETEHSVYEHRRRMPVDDPSPSSTRGRDGQDLQLGADPPGHRGHPWRGRPVNEDFDYIAVFDDMEPVSATPHRLLRRAPDGSEQMWVAPGRWAPSRFLAELAFGHGDGEPRQVSPSEHEAWRRHFVEVWAERSQR